MKPKPKHVQIIIDGRYQWVPAQNVTKVAIRSKEGGAK